MNNKRLIAEMENALKPIVNDLYEQDVYAALAQAALACVMGGEEMKRVKEALEFYLAENPKTLNFKEWERRMQNDCGDKAQQALCILSEIEV